MAMEACLRQKMWGAMGAMQLKSRRISRQLLIGSSVKLSAGVSRFTLEHVKPHLRGELNRRIMGMAEASADLIGSDREAVIEATLQRFAGWITPMPRDTSSKLTSLPGLWVTRVRSWLSGGRQRSAEMMYSRELPSELVDAPFEERWRLVMIDQGHKFSSALSEILAKDGGAIAMKWQSSPREQNYSSRPDHEERDSVIYTIRDNWALNRGFMKSGAAGYYDEITSIGSEPMCRCNAIWLYNLRDLPDEMLTPKGRAGLEDARTKIQQLKGNSE
jgi:hypothetical protein